LLFSVALVHILGILMCALTCNMSNILVLR
jgi:hypothetical protein